uniref:Acyltransferase 3 domain-containing protein n=1 Tax=Mucochytrium quahogii TaxID=96639 RepID=A0A7S2SEZ2_9STRA|mmetsp:Transcript_16512/g.28634  ORF Transcript_16512/g.28634 Transcript_16512/m.28634 type:complete len:480 (-) Transcript_16512:104-1543(-)
MDFVVDSVAVFDWVLLSFVLLGVAFFVSPLGNRYETQATCPDDSGLEEGNKPAEPVVSKPRVRLYYLDNIKSVLTEVVLLFHVSSLMKQHNGGGPVWDADGVPLGAYVNSSAGQFATGFQHGFSAFFMPVFFFISGCFTPSSYRKKGAFGFLKDKFIRLGIPVLLVIFVLSPLNRAVNSVSTSTIPGNNGFSHDWFFDSYYGFNLYFASAGPCWFVRALLVFNCMYALIQKCCKVQGPSEPWSAKKSLLVYLSLFFIVFVLTLLLMTAEASGKLSWASGFGGMWKTFFQTPNLSFANMAMFGLGCVAKDNLWLTSVTELGKKTRVVGTLLFFGILIGCILQQAISPGDSDTFLQLDSFPLPVSSSTNVTFTAALKRSLGTSFGPPFFHVCIVSIMHRLSILSDELYQQVYSVPFCKCVCSIFFTYGVFAYWDATCMVYDICQVSHSNGMDSYAKHRICSWVDVVDAHLPVHFYYFGNLE